MDIREINSVIYRKTRVARDGFDARVMSPAKAFRLSLAKAADVLFDLDVTIATIEQIKLKHGDIQKEMGDDGLLILLDGYGGSRAVLKFDMQLLSALIEVQTTGKVSPADIPARVMTRTDAAMVAPLVNALMSGFDMQMSAEFDDFRETGFGFGDMAEDARALSLVLVDPEFELFRISVDVANGTKSGCLTVMAPVPPKNDFGLSHEKTGTQNVSGLEQNTMNAPIVLSAAMARVSMPLKEIWAFQPGHKMALPIDSMNETLLLGAKGHVVSEVRLGQLNGWRAVRFVSGDDAALPLSVDDPHDAALTPDEDVQILAKTAEVSSAKAKLHDDQNSITLSSEGANSDPSGPTESPLELSNRHERV